MSYQMGKRTVIFELPPSANACWRQYKGRTILSAKYRAWREENKHLDNKGNPIVPFPFPVTICITVHPGKKWRRCDLDNRIKPILDQLQHCGYLVDDDTDWVHGVSIVLGDDAGEDFESYVEIEFHKVEKE